MRGGDRNAVGTICGALLACLAIVATSREAAADGTVARAQLERARQAMHVERLVSHGGLVIDAHGTRDLATLRQGMQSVQPERSPLATRLAVDLSHRTVAFETHGRINADADEHLRYVFRAGADTLLVDYLNSRAFGIGADEQAQAERYLATVPHLLIHGLLARAADAPVLSMAAGDPGAAPLEVAAQWPDGRALTILLDGGTRYVHAVRTVVDLPVDGPVEVTWTYEPYAEVDGVPFPRGHTVSWGGKIYEDLRYRQIAWGPPAPAEFSTPPWIAAPPPPPSPAQSVASSVPAPSPLLEVRPGVYLFRHARGGFHPLVVTQSDGLLVVDAPAPWYELSELPPSRSEPGTDTAAVGARLLAELDRHLPEQPVRRLVLTHQHGDHMGGALPFVDGGIEVIAAPATQDALAAMLRNHGRDVSVAGIRVVEGRLRVEDALRPVELIDVGPNPHSEGMLVAHLPNERLLYQSDLFEPLSPANFPSRPRLPTAQWFARWLDGSTLAVDDVFAIHGSARVTTELLDAVRSGRAGETRVAVVGATGQQGGAVARELMRRNLAVRAITRNPDGPRARALAQAGMEIVRADLGDVESLRVAFAGAHAVFGMTDFWEHGREREVEHGRNLVAAAQAANVRHLVFSSVASADRGTGIPHFDSKREIETEILDSGLPYTILRPVSFMENWSDARAEFADGQLTDPQSSGSRQQLIALGDLARIAADAIERPDDWLGVSIDLAGDELTVAEMAAVASRALGHEVTHRRMPWREAERAFGPEVTTMLRWFERTGYDVDVAALRASYPWLMRFEDFLRELPGTDPAADARIDTGSTLLDRMASTVGWPGPVAAPVLQLEWRGVTRHPYDSFRPEGPWDAGQLWQGRIVDLARELAITKQVSTGNGTRSISGWRLADGAAVAFNALSGAARSIDSASLDDILEDSAAYSPVLAVAALQRHPERVRKAADRTCRGRRMETLVYRRTDGREIHLLVDPVTHRIECADHQDTDYDGSAVPLRVEFDAASIERGGMSHPAGFTEYARGVEVRRMELAHMGLGAQAAITKDEPGGYQQADPEPPDLRQFQVRDVAPGAWIVGEGVMYQLFIELDNFLVAVDGTSGDVERRIHAITERVPDKPIRYLVVTHAHADHLHGVRAFAERGARILAAEAHHAAIRRQVGERLAAQLRPLASADVLRAADRPVQLIDIGPVPHSAHHVAVYLPVQRLLYEADLMVVSRWNPLPPATENMRALDAAIERLGLAVERIVGPHSPVIAARTKLAESVARGERTVAPRPLPHDERWKTDPAASW